MLTLLTLATVVFIAWFIVYGIPYLLDRLVEFIEPHTTNGVIYNEHLKIGRRISKAKTFARLDDISEQIQRFSDKYPDSDEAKYYTGNLRSLLTRRDMQLRSNIKHYDLFERPQYNN